MHKFFLGLIFLIMGITLAIAQDNTQSEHIQSDWMIYDALNYGTTNLDTESWIIANASEDTSLSYVQVYWRNKENEGLVRVALQKFETQEDRDERLRYFAEDYLSNSTINVQRCLIDDNLYRVVGTSPTMENPNSLLVDISIYTIDDEDRLLSMDFVFEETYVLEFENIISSFFPEMVSCPNESTLFEDNN